MQKASGLGRWSGASRPRDLLSQSPELAGFLPDWPAEAKKRRRNARRGVFVAETTCCTVTATERASNNPVANLSMGFMRGGAGALRAGADAIVKGCTSAGFCLKELGPPSDRMPFSIVGYDRS